MLQVLTPAEIAEHEARDKAMFEALSTPDKLALANIRYRLRNADDKDGLAHFVRQTVNGIAHDYADSIEEDGSPHKATCSRRRNDVRAKTLPE